MSCIFYLCKACAHMWLSNKSACPECGSEKIELDYDEIGMEDECETENMTEDMW